MQRTISKINNLLGRSKKLLYLILLISIICNFIFICYIDMVRRLINSVLKQNGGDVLHWVVLTALMLLADIIFGSLGVFIKKKFYCNIISRLRMEFFKKINNLALPKLEAYINGDLVTRFIDDIPEIAGFMKDSLVSMVSNIVMIAIFFTYVGMNDWRLIPIVLLILPITIYLVNRHGRALKKEAGNYQRELSNLNATAKDVFENAMDIKSFRKEGFFTNKYEECDSRLVGHELKRNFHRTFIWGLGIANYQVIFIVFYTLGGFLAYKGYIEFGLIVGLFLLIDRLVDLLMQIPGMFSSIYEISPKINRVYEIIDEPETIKQGNEKPDYSCDHIIEAKGLTYGYSEDRSALNGINLNIKSGERIAIVGESGCGKSTMLKLLSGYDQGYDGELKILGHEIRDWSREDIKREISYCPQEPFFMSKPIIENFMIFNDSVNDSIMEQYSAMVEMDGDIESLDDKYDTILKDGGKNISGGQKQRLGLMLGLMKKSRLYMIDEGFSALDPGMSLNILNNIFEYTKDTVLVVTHKLYEEFMNKFDRIIVMKDGRIEGTGTHNELMNNEVYRTLYEKSLQELEVQ